MIKTKSQNTGKKSLPETDGMATILEKGKRIVRMADGQHIKQKPDYFNVTIEGVILMS